MTNEEKLLRLLDTITIDVQLTADKEGKKYWYITSPHLSELQVYGETFGLACIKLPREITAALVKLSKAEEPFMPNDEVLPENHDEDLSQGA